MRTQVNVFEIPQGTVGAKRLRLEHIQSGPGEPPLLQGSDQGMLLDQLAAAEKARADAEAAAKKKS